MPVRMVGSRTRHDQWPGIAMAFWVSAPAVATNSPRPSAPRYTDRHPYRFVLILHPFTICVRTVSRPVRCADVIQVLAGQA